MRQSYSQFYEVHCMCKAGELIVLILFNRLYETNFFIAINELNAYFIAYNRQFFLLCNKVVKL